MFSISTLQIQSVKKRYQKRPHFTPKQTQPKEKTMKFETKATALKTVSHVFNLSYKARLIPTILQKKLASYLIYKLQVISILA